MKLIKKLLAMALAGVMLLTVLTGCSGGKTGDRLVEEYIAAYYHSLDHYKDIPITHDVPEIKTVAEKFDPSWLNADGSWAFSPRDNTIDARYQALKDIFADYKDSYTVILVAFEVDSKQSELDQAMRVMTSSTYNGLPVYSPTGKTTAIQCATRLVTRGDKSYRIAVFIYDHHAAG